MRWLLRAGLALVALLAVAGGAVWLALDEDERAVLASLPTDTDVLFWSTDERDAAFRVLDRFPWLARSRPIRAGGAVLDLPEGAPLVLPGFDLDAYMANQRSAAIVVVVNGQVVLERYGLGFGPEGRWTSFSVAKSLTSTLVGAALADGAIASLDDPVSRYISDLRGSAYDDVSIRQLLTMSSGVAWNEDYADPQSDVARFNAHQPAEGLDASVSYLRALPRAAPAGSRWNYNTGETNLVGVLVSQATGRPLAEYLSEKIWRPFGMEGDATWLLGASGHEIAGCCIQARTRDMARFGLFVLADGVAAGRRVVPEGWFAEATSAQADIGRPGRGYGYQWWTYADGSFAAQGIFGQGIFIDPARNLVIASNGNWPVASDRVRSEARLGFYRAVQQALDARGARQAVSAALTTGG